MLIKLYCTCVPFWFSNFQWSWSSWLQCIDTFFKNLFPLVFGCVSSRVFRWRTISSCCWRRRPSSSSWRTSWTRRRTCWARTRRESGARTRAAAPSRARVLGPSWPPRWGTGLSAGQRGRCRGVPGPWIRQPWRHWSQDVFASLSAKEHVPTAEAKSFCGCILSLWLGYVVWSILTFI